MGKDSNFIGQPVYSQVLKLLDREKIMQLSRETPGIEAYVKRFDGYMHLVVMLFGVLKHFYCVSSFTGQQYFQRKWRLSRQTTGETSDKRY